MKEEHADLRLCGGLTVYAPMIRNGAGPGKKIGVVGLGGLYVTPQRLIKADR